MDWKSGPGVIGAWASLGAGSCCAIPIGLMAVGVGSGTFMAALMPFNYILFPLGLLGFGAGAAWYVVRWRRCRAEGCAMPGGRINAMLLGFAALMMVAASYFTVFLSF